ncbi:DUF192 domain-containing protein [Roseiterribacter gracilis]|uniref:DUF192 domain-containing protein n=1 Tax=Roseiterribacter gracilis TaxID=2812848 RepID=A0A8S8X615_9PROT|nr:hypothetical protein TMPK1_05950 [Rhodospirillales bacterium TMPK1]
MRLIFALLMMLATLPAMAAESFPTSALDIETAAGQKFHFNVQLALTPAQQTQGLMYRTDLKPDAGMLFVNRDARPMSMWMKNTLIPLDMVFFDTDGRIVNIEANAVPETLTSRSSKGAVKGVLELPGGTAAKLGIRAGDKLLSPDLK